MEAVSKASEARVTLHRLKFTVTSTIAPEYGTYNPNDIAEFSPVPEPSSLGLLALVPVASCTSPPRQVRCVMTSLSAPPHGCGGGFGVRRWILSLNKPLEPRARGPL